MTQFSKILVMLLLLLITAGLADAAVTSFSSRPGYNAAAAGYGVATNIDFSTYDSGSSITVPNSDTYIDPLNLRDVTFAAQSYYNDLIYTFPNATYAIRLPANTHAFGMDLRTFYGTAGTFTVTLSTGDVYSIPYTPSGFIFFGAVSDLPIRWAKVHFNNDYHIIDNFTYTRTSVDNCPTTHNPNQVDNNNNGIGDACETTNLISHWNGDLNTNDSFDGNHATAMGPVGYSPGYSSHTFGLSGQSGGWLEAPDSPSLSLTGPFTLSAWVRFNQTNVQQAIIEKYDVPGRNGYFLRLASDGRLTASVCNAFTCGSPVATFSVLSPGVWHHVAAVYSFGGMRLYIDGDVAGNGIVGSNPTDGPMSLKIGARGDDANTRLNGKIDEVKIFGAALNDLQVRGLADRIIDPDDDGIASQFDNCPYVPNPDQADTDDDGLGDVCDPACTQINEGYIVPGTANPWLAGMPDGTMNAAGDSAPAQSPVEVVNVPVNGVLRFSSTTGSTGNCPGCFSADSEGGPAIATHISGAVNGIGQVVAPINSLIGIFLDDNAPNSTSAPGTALDFSTPASRDFVTISPALKQPFFIGDGRNSLGEVQWFVAPAGATRLFLGSMDGIEWNNNVGSFSVLVVGLCTPDSDGDGVLDANDNCPFAPNPGQEDNDDDGAGDVCDGDDDNDGVADGDDNCPLTSNADQVDFDGDGVGDQCDLDDDNDGVADMVDLCPGTPPYTLVNADGCPDADSDGIQDTADNCPRVSNADQRDTDGDGTGDACTVYQWPSGGSFVIGDLVSNAGGAPVYFWGSQWLQNNPMSIGAGAGTYSFKGFENGLGVPSCGSTWASQPGNSTPPPVTVPVNMAVIVSSSVSRSGNVLSGDIRRIVVIRTDPGYGPAPGHTGTGRIIAVLCESP